MNGLLVAAIVASVLFVALGLQVLSRQIQRSPVDVRRPDPLIDVTTTKSVTVRPAELHQLIGIISNALISDASARTELQPILDELRSGRSRTGSASTGNGSTGTGSTGTGSTGTRSSGRGRNKRWQRIERSIAELEQQWGLPEAGP